MLIIRPALLDNFQKEYGETGMVRCYAKAQGSSAITQDVILLMNDEKLVFLFISYITNRLIRKIDFSSKEILNSRVKSGVLLDDIWQFSAGGQKWFFRIQRKIIPLGNRQSEFLTYLNNNKSIM